LIAYQDAAERRRQLAAEVGELVGGLIASLVAAGWSEQDARQVNVHNLSENPSPAHGRLHEGVP
jgi:hypothetical protein